MHLDIVSEVPPGAIVIGSNEHCQCHAMIIPGRALSVQGFIGEDLSLTLGHPEFNQRIVEFLLETRHFKGILTDEIYKEAYPHAAEPHDGVKVGEGIMNFIMGVKA
jgi:GMP synthase-like glutamine amidotransferase